MTHTDASSTTASLRERIVARNWIIVELGLIVTVWYWLIDSWWAANIIPGGLEYSRSMHSFFFWQNLRQCGECAFWGNINGGGPTLNDAYGSFLHPFAAITSLQLGAMAGSAMTLSLAFLLIACVSWGFAYSLQIHPVVRLWFSLANMLGGHMLCRLELGNIGLALSLASAWAAIVALLWFIHRPSLFRVTIFAVAFASACLAGQGYMQAILISMIPLFAVYAWHTQFFALPRRSIVMYGGVVVGLVVLIVAPLWLNMLQPNDLYVKETAGENYFYQPATRLFANLLLDDFDVAKSDVYNSYPYPWVYSTFIGLTSVVFAVSGLYWITQSRNRTLYKLFMAIALWNVMIASGVPYQIAQYVPIESFRIMISGLRYLVVANGYFALAMLVMAMFALHALLTESHWWPRTLQRLFARIPAQIVLPIGVALMLGVNLNQLYQYNKSWLDDVNGYDEKQQSTIDVLKSSEFAVVDAPDWMIIPLLSNSIKMTNVVIPWQTPVYPLPGARYVLTMEQPEESELLTAQDENWSLYRKMDAPSAYAVVYHADGTATACTATANGGNAAVACALDKPGELRISEFYVPGWRVFVNDAEVDINTDPTTKSDNPHLVRINIAEGASRIIFAFRPWQATLSMVAYALGWVLALVVAVYALTKTPPATSV